MTHKIDKKFWLTCIRAFSCISLSGFLQFYDVLDFPVHPSMKLQKFARDFTITEQNLRGNPTPATPTIDLLAGVSKSLPYYKRHKILFKNGFSRLDDIEPRSHLIKRWLLTTQKYHSRHEKNSSALLGRTMREWAIQTVQGAGVALRSDDMDNLLHQWMPIYARSKKNIHALPIPREQWATLSSSILREEIRRMKFKQFVELEHFTHDLDDGWEKFAFYQASSWISLEGSLRTNLRIRNLIAHHLSADEQATLVNWIQHNTK